MLVELEESGADIKSCNPMGAPVKYLAMHGTATNGKQKIIHTIFLLDNLKNIINHEQAFTRIPMEKQSARRTHRAAIHRQSGTNCQRS